MKYLLIAIILSLTFGPRGLADQAVPLKAGEKAPFDGVLMDAEKSNTVQAELKERDLYSQIVDSQTKSIDLLKQNDTYNQNKINILLTQNDKLAEQLQSSQSLTNWERIGLAALGVAMAVGAGLAIKAASK